MALNSVIYTSDGVQTLYSVPFDYLSQANVATLVNGIPAGFEFTSANQIKLASPGSNGQIVKISRTTPITSPIVDFTDGANLTADDLDHATRQNLFANQELREDLNFWIAWVQNQTLSGSDLPPVNADNSFIVSNGTSWVVRTMAQVKTILEVPEPDTLVPDPLGYPGVLTTDGSQVRWRGLKPTRDFLNLGDIATYDIASFPILGYSVGLDEGDLVSLVNVGGDPGLPAVDGSLLTGLGREKYIAAYERTISGVNAGAYSSASQWVQRPLNSPIANEVGSSVVVGDDKITLPAGKYRVNIRSTMKVTGNNAVRLKVDGGAVILTGPTSYNDSNDRQVPVFASGQFTIGASTTFVVETASTGTNNDDSALGKATSDSQFVPNTFTILELWKLPA